MKLGSVSDPGETHTKLQVQNTMTNLWEQLKEKQQKTQ
jgi:hypothetical protein